MVLQEVHVLVSESLAVHRLDSVCQHAAVELNKRSLRQLAYECRYVLVLDIGVGVEF